MEDDLASAEERLAMATAQLQQTRVRTAPDASEAQNGSASGMLLPFFAHCNVTSDNASQVALEPAYPMMPIRPTMAHGLVSFSSFQVLQIRPESLCLATHCRAEKDS